MKVISYFEGIARWDVAWDELRPIAGIPHSAIVGLLQDRFHFQVSTPSQVAQHAGLFLPFLGQGSFVLEGIAVSVNVFEIRPTMVLASCPHTNMSKEFLVEAMSLLSNELGFRIPEQDRKLAFRSTIVSKMEKGFFDLIPKWSKALRIYRSLKGEEVTANPLSLHFGDISSLSPQHEIVLEKRVSAPEEDWLFSQMDLDTPSHEQFLNELEQLI